jgi:hypothetical protein
MAGAPLLARLVAAGGLLLTTGCVRWTHLSPEALEVHGKLGQVCSAAATPLVWSVNAALFPISVAILGRKPASHDNLGYPGLAVENGAYAACATLGLPLYALGRGVERVSYGLADRETIEDRLIDRLPFLSTEDYALLVRTAQRGCPPRYDREAGAPLPGRETDAPREQGLWSTAESPRYGSKPRLGNALAAAEWRDWRRAGRPRIGDAETAFVTNRALEFAAPPGEFAATYGPARQPLFEKERAAQQAVAAAMAGAVAEADLRASSPIVRAAAARLLAGSRAAGAVDELVRLLADPAVMVRAAAADGLASLADPEGVVALGRALDDVDVTVRQRAALALGRIGSGAAAGLLQRSLGGLEHRARFEALCALAAGGQRVRQVLADALADNDLHTRIAAAAAIGLSAADPADPLLARALADPEPWISGSAKRARERRATPGACR